MLQRLYSLRAGLRLHALGAGNALLSAVRAKRRATLNPALLGKI